MRSSTDNQTEVDEQVHHKSSAPENHEMTEENISDLKSIQQPLDMHLIQKLQVLQHMNPAIKALMNYKGTVLIT